MSTRKQSKAGKQGGRPPQTLTDGELDMVAGGARPSNPRTIIIVGG